MLGVDVVDIERLRSTLERSPGIVERIFTESERRYCRSSPDPALTFAGTLAAKEAVIKALDLGPLVAWAARIEVTRGESGAPHARAETNSGRRDVAVSISHDGGVAVAVALAL